MIDLILFSLLILVTLIFFIRSLRFFWLVVTVRRWIRTEVEIVNIGTEQIDRKIKYEFQTSFRPMVEYRRMAHDRMIVSTRVGVARDAMEYSTEKEARQVAQRIASNGCAYVHPSRAANSVLSTEVSPQRRSHYLAMLIGSTLVLLLALWLLSLRVT